MKVTNIGGDGTKRVKIDYFELTRAAVPTRPTTWGRVRSLFR